MYINIIYIHMHTDIHMFVGKYIDICMYMHMCISAFKSKTHLILDSGLCPHRPILYIYIYTYIFICVYTCMHVYEYTYKYTYDIRI